MPQPNTIERALTVALSAHRGQVDKAGAPYILHPLRLMAQMDTESEQLTALLHDVVEDSDYTLEDLRLEGVPGDVLEALKLLTHQQGEAYDGYIKRIKGNPLARKVKLADLADNMRLERIPNPTPQDLERLEKYRRANSILTEA